MPVESVTGIWDFDPSWPLGTDPKNEGDDHIRNVKRGVQQSFPNVDEPVTASSADLNSARTPPGTILQWGGIAGNIPEGFLVCDGDAVDRTTYAALYSAIGDTWGDGNGTTTFNVPDLQDKLSMGSSAGNLVGTEETQHIGSAATADLDVPQITARVNYMIKY